MNDGVEFLVIPANESVGNYLLDEHVDLFVRVDDIRRPMRFLPGIDVGGYDFDIYRRSPSGNCGFPFPRVSSLRIIADVAIPVRAIEYTGHVIAGCW